MKSNFRKNISQLMTISGVGAGASSTTPATLVGDLIYGSHTKIVIPKGMKIKLWEKSATGASTDVITLHYARNANSTTPTWVEVDKMGIGAGASATNAISANKRRPMTLRGFSGTEGIMISCAATAYFAYDIEITNAPE
jgi:hypothetical protein